MTHEEAIKILGNVSLDYTGMTLLEVNRMDEALTLAIKALENPDQRIKSLELAFEQQRQLTENLRKDNDILWKELEESRAKEGKGCLETALESFGQLVASLNEALQGMSPEEIRELLRPDEEEDHD